MEREGTYNSRHEIKNHPQRASVLGASHSHLMDQINDLSEHLRPRRSGAGDNFSGTWAAAILLGVMMAVGPGRAMAQRPIGIDVSDYQSASINWSALKNTYGISFAWEKISEGGSSSGGSHF